MHALTGTVSWQDVDILELEFDLLMSVDESIGNTSDSDWFLFAIGLA